MFALLGTTLNMTTAHHQSANGLAERANQTVKQVLRSLASGTDWVGGLKLTEFSINNLVNSSTGFSPFELDMARNPHTPLWASIESSARKTAGSGTAAESVAMFTRKIQSNMARASEAMGRAQESQAKQTDKSRRTQKFEVGDRVMIRSDAFRITRILGKMRSPFIGPFRVTEVFSARDNYKVELPSTWRHHPVFHTSKLKRYKSGPLDADHTRPGPMNHPENRNTKNKTGKQVFAVERILGARVYRGKRQYCILWKGYPIEDSQWVPEADVGTPLIEEFERAQRDEEANDDGDSEE
jgi:hypothetical protein